jgi:hypothetical protein
MKLNRSSGIGAASATTLLALVAGVSTASAQPAAAKPAHAAQVVNVMLHSSSIGFAPNRVLSGRTTLVVRSRRSASITFILARHTGGLNTLPRYNGVPFVPREEIVRISRLTTGTQKRLTLMLTTGNYLLLTSKSTLGGDSPIFVDTAARIAVL